MAMRRDFFQRLLNDDIDGSIAFDVIARGFDGRLAGVFGATIDIGLDGTPVEFTGSAFSDAFFRTESCDLNDDFVSLRRDAHDVPREDFFLGDGRRRFLGFAAILTRFTFVGGNAFFRIFGIDFLGFGLGFWDELGFGFWEFELDAHGILAHAGSVMIAIRGIIAVFFLHIGDDGDEVIAGFGFAFLERIDVFDIVCRDGIEGAAEAIHEGDIEDEVGGFIGGEIERDEPIFLDGEPVPVLVISVWGVEFCGIERIESDRRGGTQGVVCPRV